VQAFLDAGCKASGNPTTLDCKEAKDPSLARCQYLVRVLPIALEPPASVAECYVQGQASGVRQTGCMMPMVVHLVASTSDGFAVIDSPAGFAKRFAPVTSDEEAIGFAVALTGSEVVKSASPDAPKLGPTTVTHTPEGTVVRLFWSQMCGCSHATFGIDYLVTRDGKVTERTREQVWEDPKTRGLCVD
jgi:hypothetical protein